jgi:hypothetical protein
MATPVADPKKPETKPHGTTDDQITEMESEGQAQAPAETSTGRVESPSADSMEGAPGPPASDQDIDTAGTEADDSPRLAGKNPNRDARHLNVEEPGDTGSADIVDRTGEQMPQKSHDGLDADQGDEPAEWDETDRPPSTRVH